MEHLTKPGYKQTELGWIPVDWDIRNIGEVVSITTGSRNTQDKIEDGDFPFFVRSQTIERINSYSYDGEAVLTAGDGVGTGKVFHYLIGKFDIHQRVYMMSEFSENLNGYYFFLYFSRNFYDRMMQMTAKSSVDSVRREMISRMPIPLPPLPEQTAIATALSDMDSYIQSLEALIAKKRLIKQGAMQELLTPKEDWEVRKLGEVLKIKHGKNQSKVIDQNGKYPILASGGEIGRANSFLCDKPSVLIGRKGTIDKPQFMDTPFWTVDTLYFTEIFKENDPRFIFFIFLMIDWYSYNEASGVPSLSAKNIESIEKYFPTKKSEQIRISGILENLNTEIEFIDKKLSKALQIKQGMMQELLTGRTRLV
jgi:type I restriction enzyme S subunit